MSRWDRRFENSALWQKLDAVRQKVSDLPSPEDDDAKRDTLNYMSSIVDFSIARREGTPAMLVTQSMLDSVSTSVDALSNHIDYWTSGQYTNEQMDAATDGVLQALAVWPPMTPDQTVRALRSAAKQITATTEEVLTAVEGQRAALSDSLTRMEGKVETFEGTLAKQKTLMDAAIVDFGKDSEDAKESAVTEWTKERTNQSERAEETLGNLETLEREAREMVHAATGSVVATDYGKYARNKTVAAWICDIAAGIVGTVGVAAIITHLYSVDAAADGNVGLSLTRLAASLGTLGIAALVAHRGRDHHREARAAKRTDLALRRVGPFTANLSPDIRERIIVEATDRIFVRGELDDDRPPADSGPSLWDRIQQARQERESADA